MRKLLLGTACAIALAGCQSAPVTTPATATTSPLQQLATFTVADLTAAQVDALAQTPPDADAAQCYGFLASLIPTIQIPGTTGTVGAFVAFQKARDLVNSAAGANPILKQINSKCAAVVNDTNFTLAKLGLIGGAAAATAGMVVPIPVLPVQ
jgi:hypothetical protein